ncbi:hypothetical protein [Cytobacillus purgationiresistens]|uniref:Uncharacterized protein n=1 Tax=Cytobacillus purgationiresistens TaxID=863449 RepID=A0ABU0AIP8_9BACI|nr:hypothetical protein [Cytobacillus purgationiresistens]MDQ0271138.1 hypothetical protein [Cytobacillus purgationiresistens]
MSMRKKNQMRQMTDTDIIVREIRRVKVDPFYELVFWLIGKVIKIVVSIVIGFIFVPYYVFKVVYGLYKIINSKIMKQDKSQGEDM